jgi:hypothetical protein
MSNLISENQGKPWYKKPEGIFGVIVASGLFAVIGFFVLPILVALAWNTLQLGVACGSIFALYWIVTNKTLRNRLGYFWTYLMKNLLSVVMTLDPFLIAEEYIEDMEKQREKVAEKSQEVLQQKIKLDNKISEKQESITKLTAKAKAAKANNDNTSLAIIANEIQLSRQYVEQLAPMRGNLTKLDEYLTKIYKNSEHLIVSAKTELSMKKDLYQTVTAAKGAMDATMRFLKGDPEKKLALEQSAEFLKDDIAMKLASIKKSIEYSDTYMRSIDLDNAANEIKGLEFIENINIEEEFRLKTRAPEKVLVQKVPGIVQKSSSATLWDN